MKSLSPPPSHLLNLRLHPSFACPPLHSHPFPRLAIVPRKDTSTLTLNPVADPREPPPLFSSQLPAHGPTPSNPVERRQRQHYPQAAPPADLVGWAVPTVAQTKSKARAPGSPRRTQPRRPAESGSSGTTHAQRTEPDPRRQGHGAPAETTGNTQEGPKEPHSTHRPRAETRARDHVASLPGERPGEPRTWPTARARTRTISPHAHNHEEEMKTNHRLAHFCILRKEKGEGRKRVSETGGAPAAREWGLDVRGSGPQRRHPRERREGGRGGCRK